MTKLELHRREIFRDWLRDQADQWVGEYEAWDVMIEDGDITEEDWEWIRDNLTIESIKLKGDV